MTDNNTNWQNRIIGLEYKPAYELLANAKNPRRHPAYQREALRGSLDTLGWYDVVIENQRTGELLDGHARIEEQLTKDENALVPVLVVDMSQEEQDLALMEHDFITLLATYDKNALENLLHDVNTDNEALQQLAASMSDDNLQSLINSVSGNVANFDGLGGDALDSDPVPIDLQYQILIECQTESKQLELLSQLNELGIECRALIS